MDRIGHLLNQCVEETIKKLDNKISAQDLHVYSWPQLWPSTACGFGGIGGHAMTYAQTIVICPNQYFKQQYNQQYYVYHNGKFAYCVNNPNELFFQNFKEQKLAGASRYNQQYELNAEVSLSNAV